MDLGQLERYAPQARVDFIQAVTARASKLGISDSEVLEAKKSGDALIIGGNVFPASIDHKRKVLVDRVEKDGFDKVMEEAAYTWFNRFSAMRYMEIHGYIEEHPFSLFEGSDDGSEPEVLKNVADLNDWKELNFSLALDLKTQNKTEDLYRLILTAQCNSLGKIIPFLFSYHAAETELLLPDGLLLSDSIIKEMISVLNEENLREVESLGWLYQFYIAEKKDALMKAKKAYKADEIPAVTQLFTPNWIVKYLTQNSIGRLWLSVYPSSPLKNKMEYYIEPAEQTDEVNKQLAEITPDSLNPEEITVLDPACGSGHILVEAYNLLKEIYLERGYQEKEIPRLILKNNLFGLDIDDRAAQLARFVLLMKAREDDRRLFRLKDEIALNVHAIQESNEFNLNDVTALGIDGVDELIATFQDAKTFGSLLMISERLKGKLESITHKVIELVKSQSFDSEFAKQLNPLVNQALVMGRKYDVVVANPPYMGGNKMGNSLKSYVRSQFPSTKSDLFAVSLERFLKFCKQNSFMGFVTPYVWMFISSYEKLRTHLFDKTALTSLIQLEYNAFAPACIPVCCFTMQKTKLEEYTGSFIKLSDFKGSENQAPKTLEAINNQNCDWFHKSTTSDFKKIPGSPIAYWLGIQTFRIFEGATLLSNIATPRAGMITGNNERYLRFWHEISKERFTAKISSREEAKNSKMKWFPYQKGGKYRKWYGNREYVVDWENDGQRLKTTKDKKGKIPAHAFNDDYIFKPNINWSAITSSFFSVRITEKGALFDAGGSAAFPKELNSLFYICGFLNSIVAQHALTALNPTLNFQAWNIGNLPIITSFNNQNEITASVKKLVEIAKNDWDSYEISWDFDVNHLVKSTHITKNLQEITESHINDNKIIINNFRDLEENINEKYINAYQLQGELFPKISDEQITLKRNPKYRYSGSNLSDEELWQRFQFDTIKELISYSVGCIMGRYSLDEQGLIYAHSGNEGFNASKYKTFPADDDGIITLSDMEDLMVRDDIATRFTEFLVAVWGKETLSENTKFVADTLGSKTSELPKETIRRWISSEFFKDHLQRYKKRPIYWLFSSGKKKAFEALVYLHRYNESTLSRMRMKYVIPLQTRISDQLKTINDDIDLATSQERTRLTRKKKLLSEKEIELRKYDETLRHLAEQQIKLDLDEGVKINYDKFPGLLAETKIVCGK
jgi:type II restriction/modification system DNA methylase subunit YeeA